MDFAAAMHTHIPLNRNMRRGEVGPMVARIDAKIGVEKALIYKRLEAHAFVYFDITPSDKFDWNKPNLDWAGFLEFLKAILPIIMALFGGM